MTENGESVISRVVRIVDAFDRDTLDLSLSALAERSGLPISTTHRLVTEMTRLGLLKRTAEKKLRLGARLWEMSSKGSDLLALREAALPHLESLRSQVGQHVNLAVLDADSVLFVERLSYRGSIPVARVAERFPIHACSPGLVLLAFSPQDVQDEVLARPLIQATADTLTDPRVLRARMAEIRKQRFVSLPGSGISEWTGMAAPVADMDGIVVAAVSVIYPIGQEDELKAVAALHVAAQRIGRAMKVAIRERCGPDS
ncbi:IclR family transcriptional regulator [Rhodococcus sp. WS4]|nr:IclR family transcriptional regulator [Rhodococcus sp. WS4]